jgi:hypothetical protein
MWPLVEFRILPALVCMSRVCTDQNTSTIALGAIEVKEKLFFLREEIKRRLNSGNACYHSVQNLLSSRLLSKL